MAWRCSGGSNAELIDNLVRSGILSTPRVIDAFKAVDRKYYTPSSYSAYVDSPTYIGYGATISAPHMHAHAVENLEPFLKPGANVLDIGSGSGYLLGIFHSLVQPGGNVLGIDHLPGLVALARSNLLKDPSTSSSLCDDAASPVDPSQPASKTMQNICADGRQGAPAEYVPEGGWTAIHVGAAAPHLPERLVEQLASPGRMFIPVGDEMQAIYQVDKDVHGKVTRKMLFGVSYVPLTDADKQHSAGESP
ncbi:SPOSA6832_01988 [Sporobolomyces salmonicolor]|uniref:protein-L-isoaspartate(D-aspartate) O-methyltransferase n=1 Tax=Sporidiobolus salmonicolor TaxID=5005 RepID=A0A0D6EK85_SPOSA|nr:SPOSA6832_01988 [Sporobolomyces salmonicolor]